MSQEVENLVDPQDDVELNARRQEEPEQDLEEEKEVEKEPYDSGDETVDGGEKDELSREEEDNIVMTKESRTKHLPKKKVPVRTEPVPKTKKSLR